MVFICYIIYNAMQYFLRCPRMRTMAINANAPFIIVYRYTSYFIVHSYYLSRWRLSNYYRIVNLIDSALRWLNILDSISNRTSFIVILGTSCDESMPRSILLYGNGFYTCIMYILYWLFVVIVRIRIYTL